MLGRQQRRAVWSPVVDRREDPAMLPMRWSRTVPQSDSSWNAARMAGRWALRIATVIAVTSVLPPASAMAVWNAVSASLNAVPVLACLIHRGDRSPRTRHALGIRWRGGRGRHSTTRA